LKEEGWGVKAVEREDVVLSDDSDATMRQGDKEEERGWPRGEAERLFVDYMEHV
jgi:hypothetical protein